MDKTQAVLKAKRESCETRDASAFGENYVEAIKPLSASASTFLKLCASWFPYEPLRFCGGRQSLFWPIPSPFLQSEIAPFTPDLQTLQTVQTEMNCIL